MDKPLEHTFLKGNDPTVAAPSKSVHAFRIGAFALAVSAGLAFVGHVSAQDQRDKYKELMEQGDGRLHEGEAERWKGETMWKAGNFAEAMAHCDRAIEAAEEALGLFRSAENYASDQKHAVFFEGVALVLKGRAILTYNMASKDVKRGAPHAFCAAVHEIKRSITLGMTPIVNPGLTLEEGLALVGAGENEEGIQALELYLASHKGNPSQEGEARQSIASAQAAITAAKATTPSPACGKALIPSHTPSTDGKPPPSAQENESQIIASMTTGVGYDGNVTQLGRGLPLPPGLAGKGAAFNETILSLEGDWFLHHIKGKDDLIDKLAVAYAIIHDAYDEHSNSNILGQTGLLSYCHVINKELCMGFQIADTWLRDDTKNLSNVLAPQASLSYRESDQLGTKISYTLGWSKYFTPSTLLTSLDGFTNRIALEQSFIAIQKYRKWSPGLTVTGQYGHEWTTTDGIVGDRQRENPLVKAEWVIFKAPDYCSFVRSVTFTGSYEYRHDEYCNATFPALTAPTRYKRRDDTHLADFAVSIKMWYDERTKNRLEAILDYKSITDNSNVAANAFDQPRFVASLKFSF